MTDTTEESRGAAGGLRGGEASGTMRAVVCHGPEDYRLERVAIPTRGPGELLVRVEAVGICASDLKCYHGASKFWGDSERPAWAEMCPTTAFRAGKDDGIAGLFSNRAVQRGTGAEVWGWGTAHGSRQGGQPPAGCKS